jgi:hypothetical protein
VLHGEPFVYLTLTPAPVSRGWISMWLPPLATVHCYKRSSSI